MNNRLSSFLLASAFCLPGAIAAQEAARDTSFSARNFSLDEVVVTGTRNETDVRHLSQTVSVIPRLSIEKSLQPSLLLVCPTVLPEAFPCVDFQVGMHA